MTNIEELASTQNAFYCSISTCLPSSSSSLGVYPCLFQLLFHTVSLPPRPSLFQAANHSPTWQMQGNAEAYFYIRPELPHPAYQSATTTIPSLLSARIVL